MTGIEVRTDDFGVPRVAAVLTKEGAIQTPCVVNCCGKEGTQLAPPKGGLGLLWSSECRFNQLRTGIGWVTVVFRFVQHEKGKKEASQLFGEDGKMPRSCKEHTVFSRK